MQKKLCDCCDFYAGTCFPEMYQGNSEGEFPFYKVGDISSNVIAGNVYLNHCENYISKNVASLIRGTVIPAGTVVFAKIGEALKKNRRAITKTDCLVDNNAMGIAPQTNLLRTKYFYYFMLALKMEKYAEATAVPSIRKTRLEQLSICIPTIEQQTQIETLLDSLSTVISLRQHQLCALDQLIKARFVEMFGDPVANEKGWKTKPLLSMGTCKNGMNFHYDDSGAELNCLGVGDFKDYSIISDTAALPVISLNEMPSSEYLLQDDDIVFVRSNGNKKMVGRSIAVYPGAIPTTFSGFCIRYRRTNDSVITPYLLQVLKAESIRQKMYGRGANIQNLNQQTLSSLDIPVPPKEMQEQFATFVSQVDKSKVIVQEALDKAQLLFDSLMQQYFG